MEPQEPKNARNANAHAPRPVKGIGGNGAAQVRSTEHATVTLEVRSRGPLDLYPGAALKLAEQLIHEARRALLDQERHLQPAPRPARALIAAALTPAVA